MKYNLIIGNGKNKIVKILTKFRRNKKWTLRKYVLLGLVLWAMV